MIAIIGCGGVGSWLAHVMKRTAPSEDFLLVDGDTLESRNLDRQFFGLEDIGKKKATALGRKLEMTDHPEYFYPGTLTFSPETTLMVCVDNHRTRLELLQACDEQGCDAIFAANERLSAEAFYYQFAWAGSRLDPRVYYPEIEVDHTGDPRDAAIGCTGEAQVITPQLASANFMAAALALQLYVVWKQEAIGMEPEAIPHLPHRLISNLGKLELIKCSQSTRTQ